MIFYDVEDLEIDNFTIKKSISVTTPTITLTAPERSGTPQASIETEEYTATVVWLPEVAQGGTFAKRFEDVKENDCFFEDVKYAVKNGLFKCVTSTTFALDEKITREQIAAIMHRYAKYKGYDVTVGESTNILSYTDFE